MVIETLAINHLTAFDVRATTIRYGESAERQPADAFAAHLERLKFGMPNRNAAFAFKKFHQVWQGFDSVFDGVGARPHIEG